MGGPQSSPGVPAVIQAVAMSEQPRLGRDVFLALAAIGWADGHLDADEADAIVRTAVDEGLDLEAIEEIEAATKEPVDIGVIDRKNLSKEDRLFVYAVASWMTRLDGEVSQTELLALERLGEALKVPERPRQYADQIAQEVAGLSESDRPARYDLRRLREVIGERLRASQAARAEAAAAQAEGAAPDDGGAAGAAPDAEGGAGAGT